MKIVNQTQDEMVLKDSGIWKMVFGVGFMIFGIVFGFMMYKSGGTHGVSWAIPGVLFVVGLLSVLFFPSIIVNINKANGQIVYQKKRLIGTRITTYAVADVSRIETRKQWEIQNTPRRSGVSTMNSSRLVLIVQSVLIFKDSKELPLDIAKGAASRSTSSYVALAGNEASVAKKVAEFLNVPFQEIEPPSLGGPTFGSSGTIQS